MRALRCLGLCSLVLATTACVAAPDDDTPAAPDGNVFGLVELDPSIDMTRGNEVYGTILLDDGSAITFSSVEDAAGAIAIRVELDGLRLSYDSDALGVRTDGVLIADGSPAQLTELDRNGIARLLAGVEAVLFPPIEHVSTKADYDAVRAQTPAEAALFRTLDTMWSQWPLSAPLQMAASHEQLAARSWTSVRSLAYGSNYVLGWHDCNSCSNGSADCQDWARLGRYFSGNNFGNCGTSDNGSQFTWDCTDHDQCVRTTKHGGHVLASMYCNDEFSATCDDEMGGVACLWIGANGSAPSCDYDWRGSGQENNCPASWIGTNDGCDCFCQSSDSDCYASRGDD